MHEDDPLRAALATLTDRVYEEAGRRADALAADALAVDRAQLTSAVAAFDKAHSLTAVLDALAAALRRDASHGSLLIVRGRTLEPWKEGSSFPLKDDDAVGRAVRSNAVVVVPAQGAAPSVAPAGDGRPGVAIPIAVGGDVVAVVYAEQTRAAGKSRPLPEGADWHLPIQVLVKYATRCLESVIALRTARFVADETGWGLA